MENAKEILGEICDQEEARNEAAMTLTSMFDS